MNCNIFHLQAPPLRLGEGDGGRGKAAAIYVCLAAVTLLFSLPAHAQTPRLSALYPAGARTGQTVDVAVKGGGMAGARSVLVTGAPGVTAALIGGAANVDDGARPLFQSKCTTCHEPRSPANRSLSPEQWAQTVDRMITQRGAEIAAPDKTRIVNYLQALAKAGKIGVKIQVAPDAAPGIREVRILTGQGVSTACAFEVGTLPEVECATNNKTAATAQKLTLPVVVNGVITDSGQKQFFAFDAKKGQRLTLSLKAFRLNEQSAAYFNPTLTVYDAAGNEVAKDLGREGLDPVIDFNAPADDTYTVLVHDLIWKGSPSSVYRLGIGPMPDGGILTPVVAPPGTNFDARMMPTGSPTSDSSNGSTSEAASGPFPVRVPEGADGVTMVATPMGEAPILVRDLPDGGGPNLAAPVALPALFRGWLALPGQKDTFHVHARRAGGSLEIYARRLGSPLRALVTVTNAKDKVIARRLAEGDDDLRIPNAFPAPGDYTVTVTDGDGNGGAAYAYCWESRDGTPDFSLTTIPDLVNIAPGTTTALTVHMVRRESLKDPITVSVRGLPAGVTATDAVMLPGMNDASISLTAAPTATVAAGTITVEGKITIPGLNGALPTVIVRRARPIEIYRVNNNAQYLARGTGVVAVTTDSPTFTLELANPGPVTLAPGGEAKVTVRVLRQAGFKGDVQLSPMGLPPGISGPSNVNVKANQTEATITLRASGDARYLADKALVGGAIPKFVIGAYPGGGGFGSFDGAPAFATPPIALAAPPAPTVAAAK